VNTDERGPVDEVRAIDRVRVETNMAHGHRAGLLGVVDEVGLNSQIGVVPDDLGGVLVRADRAIGTQTEEDRAHASVVGAERRIVSETGVADVVDDPDGESIARLIFGGFVEDSLCHRGGELFAAQSVAPTDHPWSAAVDPSLGRAVPERAEHIEVQRLEWGAWLFRAIKDDNRARAGRQCGEQCLGRKGPIKAHNRDANAFACGHQFGHRFSNGASARAHQHNHAVGVGGAEVVDEVILTRGEAGETIHRRLDGRGHIGVERTACFAGLEVHVGVLCASAQHRSVGVEATGSMSGNCCRVDQRNQVLLGGYLDRCDFVAGAKAVEEVQKGYACVQRGRVRDRREVGGLLHTAGAQHGEAGRAGRHYIAVIAEDAERMCGDGPGSDVDDCRSEFASDLEHVGQHQQQALAGRECGTERAASDRSVQRASCAGFALHLNYLRHRAPQVGVPLRAQIIGEFAHRRRGRDRIDGDHLRGEVGDARCRFVSVDYDTSRCAIRGHNRQRYGLRRRPHRGFRPICLAARHHLSGTTVRPRAA